MFSTLFYIFLLFYDGLFSKSSEEYNAQIVQLNKQLSTHHYNEALMNAKQIQKSSIFTNPEIEHIIAVLELRTHQNTKRANSIFIKDHSVNNDILYSYFMAMNGHLNEGYADLHRSIIQNGNPTLAQHAKYIILHCWEATALKRFVHGWYSALCKM